MTNKFDPALQLLRLPEVLSLLRISRSTFYEGIKLGIYPKGVRLGKRSVAWWLHDLLNSLASSPK